MDKELKRNETDTMISPKRKAFQIIQGNVSQIPFSMNAELLQTQEVHEP
jgi:hypothetical protein